MFNLNDVPFQLVKGESPTQFGLMVDGIAYPKSTLRFPKDVQGRDYVFTGVDSPVIKALLECTLRQLDDFEAIVFKRVADGIHLPHSLEINFEKDDEDEPTGNIYACLTISPDLAAWKSDYSFEEYCTALLSRLKECTPKVDRPELHLNEGIADIVFSFWPSKKPLGKMFEPYLEAFELADRRMEDLFRRYESTDGLSTSFDFPDELRAPCMQYLTYFSEFLRDLGISADSTLREDAGRVLFSVTPQDGIEALDRISEALAIYLRLPASPVKSDGETYETDRLLFQIETLKHQIRMKERELSMADREIGQLNYWIDRLSIAGKEVETKQLSGATEEPQSTDVPKAIGLTTVKKLADYGVHLDLGEVFRRLRGKKEE